MPAIDASEGPQMVPEPLSKLPFEPITRSHIMHCSYDFWHPKYKFPSSYRFKPNNTRYRASALKSRIIPLSPAFLSYLREDGIDIPYVLVLRKWFKVNPSCEFRCFVKDKRIIGICQRDLNHFDFLFPMKDRLRDTILEYFEKTLKNTFPDGSFAFDIYLPAPYDKVRLVDINPWAPRTDPLLFSWLELLTMPLPKPLLGIPESDPTPIAQSSEEDTTTEDEDVEEVSWKPEFRLVRQNDPEAYSFVSPQYSAHKLPRDVVDASLGGERAMRDFADNWKGMMEGSVEMQRPGERESEDEDGEVLKGVRDFVLDNSEQEDLR
ncbi:putative cell division cycle protein [Diplocarpon rosae]|nr:putative cell division cycle protein [Diplocarpon rosae]